MRIFHEGDPIPNPDETVRRKRTRRPNLLVLGLLLIGVLAAWNTVAIYGVTGGGLTAFPTRSLITVSASFGLGQSPNSIVLTPGGSTPVTLTIQGFTSQTVYVSFDVSNGTTIWSYTPTGFPTVNNPLTMTLSGIITAPRNGANGQNNNFAACQCVTVSVPVSLVAGQTSQLTGSLSLDASADPTAIPSLTIGWFASPSPA